MMNKTILALGCLLSAVFGAGCVHTQVRGTAVSAAEVTIEDTVFVNHRYAAAERVRVEQPALPVRILPGETDSITVKCYVERMRVNVPDYRIGVRRSDSALEIYQEPVNGVSVRDVSGYLEIYVPAGVKEITLKTVSGRIDIEGVSVDRLRATNVSGGIEIRESKADDELQLRTLSGGVEAWDIAGSRADIETVSGGIRGKNIDFDILHAKAVQGGIVAYLGGRTRQVYGETISGGVRLFLKGGDLGAHRYDLRTITGGIRVAGVVQAQRKYHSDGRAGGISVEAEAVAGGIAVRRW